MNSAYAARASSRSQAASGSSRSGPGTGSATNTAHEPTPRSASASCSCSARRAGRDPQPVLHRREAQPAQAGSQQRPLGAALLGDGVADERPAPVPRSHRAGELERQTPPFGHHPRAPLGHRVRGRAPRPGGDEDAAAGEAGDRRPGTGMSDPELAEDQHERGRRDRITDVEAVLADEGQQHVLGREAGLEPRELAGLDGGQHSTGREPRLGRRAGSDRSRSHGGRPGLRELDERHDSRRIPLRR